MHIAPVFTILYRVCPNKLHKATITVVLARSSNKVSLPLHNWWPTHLEE